MNHIQTHIKLILGVVGFDVGAEFIKGSVVVFDFEVDEFVNDNHTQKRKRSLLEDASDAYLVFAFDFVALDTVGVGVGAKCVVDGVDGAIVEDFAKGWGFFEVIIFERLGIGVERFVVGDGVGVWVALEQELGEAFLVDECGYFLDGGLAVGGDVA